MDQEFGTKTRLDAWKVAPRITELSPSVPVVGFTHERSTFVRGLVERIGLPVDRVSRIKYGANTSSNENVLGTAHMVTGELTFYKRMEGLPEIAQLGVGVHELTHVNSPFVKDNLEAYRSEEQMAEARANAVQVALQTDQSGRFLNPYHKMLHEQFKAGKIDSQRFVEETNAIMMELKFTNSKHLREVLDSQARVLASKMGKDFTNVTQDILNQIDKTLLVLMPQFNTTEELASHIQSLKNHYSKSQVK